MLSSRHNEEIDNPAGARLAARLGSLSQPAVVTEGESADSALLARCFHCGQNCPSEEFTEDTKVFCCQGCLLVHQILSENGLSEFYRFRPHPGVRVRKTGDAEPWRFLDKPELQQKLLDFTDGTLSRVTLHIPAIHCVACVWLLESLFRLHPGIGASRVNFPRREVTINFSPAKITLAELVGLLVSLGYEPELTLGELDKKPETSSRRLWLQIGVAGFAFGNIMLFSLPGYLGLDGFNGALFKRVFGWLSLALAAPVLIYSAADYWRSAWLAFRRRLLTLDVPIALGLLALYAQSGLEITSGRGEGYLDSLAGLVFLLLCGRAFQQRTYERLEFDRDYKSFFPLSVTRHTERGQERVSISQLRVGDRLLIRNGELIPADTILQSPTALIDYSFVTGESEPVAKKEGDYLYAGGRQVGGVIELKTVKPVSQSYLTSLWNHETFRKDKEGHQRLNSLTNRYSRRFTLIVVAIAVLAGVSWALAGDPARGIKAFTSVLIVACPCALALAAPFALGTAQRILSGLQMFMRNPEVLEHLAEGDTIVFDKTGTLTGLGERSVSFHPAITGMHSGAAGTPSNTGGSPSLGASLVPEEQRAIWHLAASSAHPHTTRIAAALVPHVFPTRQGGLPRSGTGGFLEEPGYGVKGSYGTMEVCLGSRAWLERHGISVPAMTLPPGSGVLAAINGSFRGVFVLSNPLRGSVDEAVRSLRASYRLALLSGDNAAEAAKFRELLGPEAHIAFHQSPLDKLEYIRRVQKEGRTVVMLGDGLNDSGALQQSDVGVALVEQVGMFSPASDLIIAAPRVSDLHRLLRFARSVVRIIRASFGISAAYNLLGVAIAASGVLSPLICAVLMPLSSISVVLFACGTTAFAARQSQLTGAALPEGAVARSDAENNWPVQTTDASLAPN